MNGRVLRVTWYRFRATFSRRWVGYLSVVVLIGSVGGLALASVAGARRTQSSFPTYVASTNPSTVELFSRYDAPSFGINTGYDAHQATMIEHLPLVKRAATAIIFDANIDLNSVTGSGVNVVRAKLDGQSEEIFAEKPGAPVGPPLLSGHGLKAHDEIVLGPQTLSQLHKRVGDTLTLNDGFSKPTKLVIVGTATMPAITGAGMGSGAVASTSDFPAALLNVQGSTIPGPNLILVRVRPGVNLVTARRSLAVINAKINAIPAASGLADGVISLLRPAEIVNFRSMGTTPAVLAAGLAVGAVVALGFSLAASVNRRRRVLALLKALGFTQRQLASSVAWQASVAALTGCVVGMPLGIALGRELWVLFARSIFAVPRPTVPIWSLVLVGVGALAFANLVAALPGRSAARTPTALVLRAE